ncbi:MAG: hypothetical protein RIT11_550 [Pseudomonadota bacterium]|jgi:teichuronic acid biosynthesis glycosyltransferase TuaG
MEISVVIPCFNCSDIIERTLMSICKQTLLPKEVIIIDDCSDESHSLEFLIESRSKYPFQLIVINHDENKGAPAARNTGIKATQYDYIAFLDSDDYWVEDKLEKQSKIIRDFDLIYCNYSETMQSIDYTKSSYQNVKIVGYFHILKKNLSPVTLLMKKSTNLFFDERFRRCDDFKMSIEALDQGLKIGFLDVDLAYGFKRSIGSSGLTGSLTKMSISFIKACLVIIYERPHLIFKITPFILFELLKFPIRCLKVFILMQKR